MPQIPIYNQGLGPTVKLASGQLSRRPDVGAFMAQSEAGSNLLNLTAKIATDFATKEREREDERIIRQEWTNAYDVVGSHTTADKSTNMEDASASYEAMVTKLRNDIKGKNYGKRREQLIEKKLTSLLATQKLQVKQNAHNRGMQISGLEHDSNIQASLRKANEFPAGSIQFNFYTDAAREAARNGAESGLPMKFNPIIVENEIANKIQSQTRGSYADKISNAVSESDLDSILSGIEDDTVMSEPDKSVLRSSVSTKRTEIEQQQVGKFASYLPVEDIGSDDFNTVENLEFIYQNAVKGEFGAREDLKSIWEASDDTQRAKFTSAMRARVDEAKRSLEYQQRQKSKQESDANSTVYSENIANIRAGQMTPQEIRNLDFVGKEGENLRSQLLTVAENTLRGAPLTADNITADRDIRRKVDRGEITSLTQKFKLFGETKALSILERENNQLTSARVDDYATFFREETRRKTGTEEKLISQFLSSKEMRVRGSSLLINKPTPQSDERMEVFAAIVRQKIRDGKEQGKTVEQMLNPLDMNNYIMPEDVITGYIPSKATLLKETKDLLSPKDVITSITLEEARNQMPTRKDMGLPPDATFQEMRSHPLFQLFEQSIYGLRLSQSE